MKTKTESQLRNQMKNTESGKLLLRAGFDPYDTETSARRVAEHAVKEAEEMHAIIADLREIVCRDFLPQIAHCTCQDYGQMNDALMRATKIVGPYKKS